MDKQEILKRKPKSYWIASTQAKSYPALDEDINVDFLIIGGGLTGITTAYLLQKEGLKVAVLEADHIARGTTGHTTAKITSQHDIIYSRIQSQLGREPAEQYAYANETAIREIKKVIDENGIDCDFEPQSAFLFTQQDE